MRNSYQGLKKFSIYIHYTCINVLHVHSIIYVYTVYYIVYTVQCIHTTMILTSNMLYRNYSFTDLMILLRFNHQFYNSG